MITIEKLYEPLGRVVVLSSQLESILMALILDLTKLNRLVGVALVTEMAFKKRLDALASIAPFTIKDCGLRDRLTKILISP